MFRARETTACLTTKKNKQENSPATHLAQRKKTNPSSNLVLIPFAVEEPESSHLHVPQRLRQSGRWARKVVLPICQPPLLAVLMKKRSVPSSPQGNINSSTPSPTAASEKKNTWILYLLSLALSSFLSLDCLLSLPLFFSLSPLCLSLLFLSFSFSSSLSLFLSSPSLSLPVPHSPSLTHSLTHGASCVTEQHDTNKHRNHVCVRAHPQWVLAAARLVRRTARLWPLRPAPVLRGRGALWSAAPSLRCAGLRRRDELSQGLPAWNPAARFGLGWYTR